jgi:hypothetical protein
VNRPSLDGFKYISYIYTGINAGDFKNHISAMAYRSQNGSYFNQLANYYDPIGYLNVSTQQYINISQNYSRYHHTVDYLFQQLKWVAIPDPDYWNININQGLTPSLNP